MCEHTKIDKVFEKVDVTPIDDKMRERHLRCLSYVERIPIMAPIRCCENLNTKHIRE